MYASAVHNYIREVCLRGRSAGAPRRADSCTSAAIPCTVWVFQWSDEVISPGGVQGAHKWERWRRLRMHLSCRAPSRCTRTPLPVSSTRYVYGVSDREACAAALGGHGRASAGGEQAFPTPSKLAVYP